MALFSIDDKQCIWAVKTEPTTGCVGGFEVTELTLYPSLINPLASGSDADSMPVNWNKFTPVAMKHSVKSVEIS